MDRRHLVVEEPGHPLLVPAEPIQPASLGKLPPLSQGSAQ